MTRSSPVLPAAPSPAKLASPDQGDASPAIRATRKADVAGAPPREAPARIASKATGPKMPAKTSTKSPGKTPAKVPQGELFLLDSPLHGEIRGERSLMAFPFFALSKNAWMKPLSYRTDTVTIEVRPSASGVATIYDKEIVLYIASLMAAKLEAGDEVAQDFVFTAHDLFSVTGSNHSARSYGRLSEALERLQGTQIKTNIEAGGEGEEGFFSWLSEAKLHYSKTRSGERRLKAIKVRLCDWLFRAILLDRHVLDYAIAYFQLGPIERRIYEVARSTGDGDGFEIDLPTFRLQIGYQNPLANFRAALKQIAGTDTIPDYHLELVDTAVEPEEPGRRGRKANPVRVMITRRPIALAPALSSEPLPDSPPSPDPRSSTAEPLDSAASNSEISGSGESPATDSDHAFK
ncbi:replication initiator protein A [Sphingomonas sp. BK036]|uniref:replication initiator protein A n=1 Tax=Sphingomonas sp. BK036 TaxID=2512122 RepID=UPI0010E50A4C|nr:replication initiator protein A [Sphingomonas sp. BK036]RZT44869.1 replication initiator protein A [Sphingomonas sp. BK036]